MADGEDRTSENVRQNEPVAYRVDFPLPTSPPKITSIRINGKEICSASVCKWLPDSKMISFSELVSFLQIPRPERA